MIGLKFKQYQRYKCQFYFRYVGKIITSCTGQVNIVAASDNLFLFLGSQYDNDAVIVKIIPKNLFFAVK